MEKPCEEIKEKLDAVRYWFKGFKGDRTFIFKARQGAQLSWQRRIRIIKYMISYKQHSDVGMVDMTAESIVVMATALR